MAYYIGFFNIDLNKMMKFYSSTKPTKKEYPFFGKVTGPYETEREVDDTMKVLKRAYGYRDNPVSNKIKKSDIIKGMKQAIKLTQKLMKEYDKIKSKRKGNPGKEYHDRKFMMYLKELDKYRVGSQKYIATLAKAYEHLQSAKDSEHEKAR